MTETKWLHRTPEAPRVLIKIMISSLFVAEMQLRPVVALRANVLVNSCSASTTKLILVLAFLSFFIPPGRGVATRSKNTAGESCRAKRRRPTFRWLRFSRTTGLRFKLIWTTLQRVWDHSATGHVPLSKCFEVIYSPCRANLSPWLIFSLELIRDESYTYPLHVLICRRRGWYLVCTGNRRETSVLSGRSCLITI